MNLIRKIFQKIFFGAYCERFFDLFQINLFIFQRYILIKPSSMLHKLIWFYQILWKQGIFNESKKNFKKVKVILLAKLDLPRFTHINERIY